jgi:uncharacterized protein with PIN domain
MSQAKCLRSAVPPMARCATCKRPIRKVGDGQGHRFAAHRIGSKTWMHSLIQPICQQCCNACGAATAQRTCERSTEDLRCSECGERVGRIRAGQAHREVEYRAGQLYARSRTARCENCCQICATAIIGSPQSSSSARRL